MTDPLRVELVLQPDQVEAIAERVAELLADRAGASAPASPFFTLKEACEFARCKPQRIYDLRSSGKLTRYGDGRSVRVERAELEAILAASPGVATRNGKTVPLRAHATSR